MKLKKTSVNNLQISVTIVLRYTQHTIIVEYKLNNVLTFHIFSHNIFIEYNHFSILFYFNNVNVLSFTQVGILRKIARRVVLP